MCSESENITWGICDVCTLALTVERAAPTTIPSRYPFPLGLCSCSTLLSKMGRIPDVSVKDVSAKTWRRTFRQKHGGGRFGKKYAETSQAKNICRNVSYDMWGMSGVCTLALTFAKTSSHYDRFANSVPARSLLLFDFA